MKKIILSCTLLLITSSIYSQKKESRAKIKSDFEKFVTNLPELLNSLNADKPMMAFSPIEPDAYTKENETVAEPYQETDGFITLKLSNDNATLTFENEIIQLTKLEGNEAHIIVSQDIDDKTLAIQSISVNGNYLDNHSKSENSVFSKEIIEYLENQGPRIENILANFDTYSDKDLRKLTKKLKEEVNAKFSENRKMKKIFLRFPGNIKEVIVYLEK